VDLILWRHAEAHPAREDQSDLDRALTPKGERQAQRMAEWLNARLAHSTRVLCSPAVRCRQTVAALDRPFKTVAELAPEGSVEQVLAAARWPRGPEPALIVGHQPTLGLVASTLLAGEPMAWSVKKAAVWWLRLREREDEDGSALRLIVQAVQAPDCL
jgi:phosphohistidine phosphatase